MHLDDVLDRRLHLNFEDWSRGTEAAPAVAARMARELGWDDAETARQVAALPRRAATAAGPRPPAFTASAARA